MGEARGLCLWHPSTPCEISPSLASLGCRCWKPWGQLPQAGVLPSSDLCAYWWLQGLHVCLLVAAGAPRTRERWSPATVPSTARLDLAQPCSKERWSREHRESPSAA